MPGLEIIGLLVLLVLVVLVVSIAVRRVVLMRNGGFALCWRTTTTPHGQGWKFGQGRYEDRGLVLYRSFSPFPLPARILVRGQVTLGSPRDPIGGEPDLIPPGWIIQTLSDQSRPIELALPEEAITGLRSWVESVPPQSRSLSRRRPPAA